MCIRTWLILSIHIATTNKSKMFQPRKSSLGTKQLQNEDFAVKISYSCSLLVRECLVSIRCLHPTHSPAHTASRAETPPPSSTLRLGCVS